MKSFFLLLIVAFTSTLYAEQLQYLPNKKTSIQHTLSMEISQSLPKLKLNLNASQKVNFAITFHDKNSGMPILQPPFDIEMILKNLTVDLTVNDKSISFSANDPGTSLYLAEFDAACKTPILLHVNDDGKLDENTPSLKALIKETPLFDQFQPQSLLERLTAPITALAGKKLETGTTYTANHVDYTITAAEGLIAANIESAIGPIEVKLPLEDGKATVVMRGFCQGKAIWNSDNALDYSLETTTKYEGTLSAGEWSWPLFITINERASPISHE